MSRRDSFLLRTDPEVLDALRQWASDELRSANAQLDFVLRRALRDAGREPKKKKSKKQKAPKERD
ncbi:MAG: hypothetical protein AAGA81_20905 [Acidobacteriota bacterium]